MTERVGTAAASGEIRIGYATPVGLWNESLQTKHRVLDELFTAGIDHVYMADHISFRGGHGTDGFVEIAGLSQLHDHLGVMISVYLLALRHPMAVARQMATMTRLAPGRVTLGVGVGGDDRHEIEVSGIDPKTRGRRTDECLQILRGLADGEPLDFQGEFFDLRSAAIKPPIGSVPILVGGRSDAALVRTARYGDGWIGAWCSPRRFAEAIAITDEAAAAAGRQVDWCHGYQPWIGVGPTREDARRVVADAMEAFYHVPFERFERYTPHGSAEEVAAQLRPYIDAGCRLFNLKVVADDERTAMESAGHIAALLRG